MTNLEELLEFARDGIRAHRTEIDVCPDDYTEEDVQAFEVRVARAETVAAWLEADAAYIQGIAGVPLRRIVNEAGQAFWGTVAKCRPDARSGDLDPGEAVAFERAATRAVEAWIDGNCATANELRLANDEMLACPDCGREHPVSDGDVRAGAVCPSDDCPSRGS